MANTPSTNTHHDSFEGIRREDEHGNEFWSARELAPLLEYQQWRNFVQVVDKAKQACAKSETRFQTILLTSAKWST